MNKITLHRLKIYLLALVFAFSTASYYGSPVLAQAAEDSESSQEDEQEVQSNYTDKEPGFRDDEFMSSNKVEFFDPSCSTEESGSGSSGSTSEGGGCGIDEDMNQENKDQIWSFFLTEFQSYGFSKDQAEKATAGIMGNIEQESGFNSHISEGMGCNTSPAVGIVQWCFSRIGQLDAYAASKGTERGCMGTQLEFVWKELNEGYSHLFELFENAESPGEAASIFDHGGDGAAGGIGGFEESHDSLVGKYNVRPDFATAIYEEYTGKSADALSGGSQDCEDTSTSSGGIMDADCEALVAKYEELRKDENRLVETVPDAIDDDLSKCSEGVHQCNEGINPYLLRAVVALIENSGDEATEIWNMNNRHPCDKLNHPKGLASDIFCYDNANQGTSGYSVINGGKGPSKEKCNRIFKFLYDNYEELKLVELIWNAPTDFSAPGDGKHMAVAGHQDHIHIGVNPDVGGQNK